MIKNIMAARVEGIPNVESFNITGRGIFKYRFNILTVKNIKPIPIANFCIS